MRTISGRCWQITAVSDLVEATLSVRLVRTCNNRPCVELHVSHSRYAASWTASTWLADARVQRRCVYVYRPATPVSRRCRLSQTHRASRAESSPQTRHLDKWHQSSLQAHRTSRMPTDCSTQYIITSSFFSCKAHGTRPKFSAQVSGTRNWYQ